MARNFNLKDMKRQILLISAMLFLGIVATHAQTADKKWGLGVQLGTMEYNGDYEDQFYSFSKKLGFGANVSRYLNPSFDLLGQFFYGKAEGNDGGRLSGLPTILSFDASMYNLNLLAKYKLNNGYILKETARFAPYLLGGLGANLSVANGAAEIAAASSSSSLDPSIFWAGLLSDKKTVNPNLYGGLGVNIRVTEAISVAVQTAIIRPFTDKIDAWYPELEANKHVDFFTENTVGVNISLGKSKKKDSDGDGVPDKLDKCPDTPAGVPVDADGCPLDSDKDGVPDYLDKCPNTPPGVKVDADGCPLDTDKDGVPDYLDECPDVPGLVALNGCPDSDGDGVPDKDDRCPNTPKGYKVDRFGCPLDSDQDGIPDSEDDCPDKPGVAELKGCPFDAQAIIGKYNISMKPLYFDFDSYKLKPEGIETLDKIANALSNHQDFGVQFDGHADYTGPEEYNLGLSERRANSAKGYLLKKGIVDNRIRLQYFGESKPAQDNRTKAGRALNRRVEYSLFELGK